MTIPRVYLVHGVFDSYNTGLFNIISNQIYNTDKNIFIVLSLDSIPANMITPGIWKHSIYIDGDAGLENMQNHVMHSFKSSLDFEKKYNDNEFKEKKKQLAPFSKILGNFILRCYAEYLASYDVDLNQSRTILCNMITIAKSAGAEDTISTLFHDNAITNGETMLKEIC